MDHKIIDLHVHSNCSDGTLSPEELVAYALKKGLSAIALTDHDTFQGLSRAHTAASGTPLEIINGIEFSTVYHDCDVHIVGLDLDPNHPAFHTHMEQFQNSRTIRNEQIIRKMQQNGFDISLHALHDRFGDTILTRAHFARYLFEHNYVSSISEAFELYLKEGRPYYIPRTKITPQEVVQLISQTGGIAVLAHPMLYRLSEPALFQLIQKLIPLGLIGIETIYSSYTAEEETYVRELAASFHLTPSGGSDFHGSNKPGLDLAVGYGNLQIPYEILDNLRKARRQRYE